VRTAWQTKLKQTKVPGRALLLQRIRNLELRDVTVRDSYSWNVHLVECDHARVDNVKVLSNVTHSNGDGFDIDGCVDVEMSNCFVYAEDDAISPKASWSHRTPEKYRIRDCILWSQNATGIRLGDETDAPEFRDMVFENIDILRANSMLRIYNYDGGDLHGIVFRNLWLEEYSADVQELGYEETARTKPAHEGVTSLLHIYVRQRTEKSNLGVVHDILLDGIHSRKLAKTRLTGTARDDGRKSIRDIRFRDCWEGDRALPTLEALRVKVGEDAAEVSVIAP
jgi:polygalacturonase